MAAAKPKAKAKPAAAAKSAKSLKSELAILESPPKPSLARAIDLPAGIRVVKNVTMPSLTLKPNEPHCLVFVSPMRISSVITKAGDGKDKEPATIADVGDVETGEAFIGIIPAVVKSNLERDYPNDGYVGKTFYIENLGKRTQGQRYNDFRILEIDPSEMLGAPA